jgi:hypothetical protein
LLIAISVSDGADLKNTIYYDTSNRAISEKMACMLMQKMLESNPNLKIGLRPYDNSLISENKDIFEGKKSSYRYFVYIDINIDQLNEQDFSKHLENTIREYYG